MKSAFKFSNNQQVDKQIGKTVRPQDKIHMISRRADAYFALVEHPSNDEDKKPDILDITSQYHIAQESKTYTKLSQFHEIQDQDPATKVSD